MLEKKVSFYTLGCRLNFAETGTIAEAFEKKGHKIVSFDEPADIVFINTCTVTNAADSDCRNIIRKAKKISPNARIIVAGCYAQVEAEKIMKIDGVDLVLGTSEKHKVFDYLDNKEIKIKVGKSSSFWGASTTLSDSHTRAFFKIQDGCNYACSYCIIPFARGRSRAISIADAVINIKKLIDNGFKEIVLTGVNIGEYESNTNERFSNLVKAISDIKGLQRLRISSIEPNTVTDDLIEVLKSSSVFMDYFHIPLQSGDDEILNKMKRRYDSSFYRKTILKIKENFPNAGIGADVIVGFPTETEKNFRNTYEFIENLPISHLHIFPYSKRKNTIASNMDGHLTNAVKKERVAILSELKNQKLKTFSSIFLNKTMPILFEQKKDDYFIGHTSNFLEVRVKTDLDLKNKILDISIDNYIDGFLFGSIA